MIVNFEDLLFQRLDKECPFTSPQWLSLSRPGEALVDQPENPEVFLPFKRPSGVKSFACEAGSFYEPCLLKPFLGSGEKAAELCHQEQLDWIRLAGLKSRNTLKFGATLQKLGWHVIVSGGFLELYVPPMSFDEYLKHFSSRKRSRIRKYLKENSVTCEKPVRSLLEECQALEARTWKAETGVLSPSRFESTLRLTQKFPSRLYLLRRETVKAWMIVFVWNDRAFLWNSAFDPEARKLDCGSRLMSLVMSDLLGEGLLVEFLGKPSIFKDLWAVRGKERICIKAFRKSLKGMAGLALEAGNTLVKSLKTSKEYQELLREVSRK